jgi:hypothetical protein
MNIEFSDSALYDKIIRNRIRTPDGTVLESRHRHDYVSYTDANGETYMVDGGTSYLRRSMNVVPYEDLTVTLEDEHDVVRENLLWGTYGQDGDQPLKLVCLADMDTDHIQACLDNVPNMVESFRIAMENELKYRGQ